MLKVDLEQEDPNASKALGWINKVINMCMRSDDEPEEAVRRTSEIEQLDGDDDGMSRAYSQFDHDKKDH